MSLPTLQEVVDRNRLLVIEGIVSNTDLTEVYMHLLNLDCDLEKRYPVLRFNELLIDNSQTLDQLKKLGLAFNIFEKYCRHLLKPMEQRSAMWRFVKFTNNIFRERVDIVQGARDIMRTMGYTQDIQDGLSFPPDAETDPERLIHLLADILCAKNELDLYLLNKHPHPERVEFLLSHAAIQEVRRFHKQFEVAQTPVLPGSQRQSQTQVYQPPSSVAQSSSQSNPSSGSKTQPMRSSLPESVGSSAINRSSVSSSPYVMQNSAGYIDESAARLADSTRSSPERHESIVCDICGESTADLVCTICDNKQLCPPCDDRWHQHPKRKNHTRNKIHCSEVSAEEYVSAEEIVPPPKTYKSAISPPPRAAFPTPPPPKPHQTKPSGGYVNFPQTPTLSGEGQERTSGPDHAQRLDPAQRMDPARPYRDSSNSATTMTGIPSQMSQSYSEFSIPTQNASANMGYATLPHDRSTPSHAISHYTGSLPRPAPGGPPTSKLLPNIMSITDLDKRRSKLNINIMSLQEEIEDIEGRIQSLVAKDAAFYEDEEYGILCRKKGMFQREMMELQKYGRELDEMIDRRAELEHHGTPPHVSGPQSYAHQPIYYPPPYTSMAMGPQSTSPGSIHSHGGVVIPYSYSPNQGGQPHIYFPPTSGPPPSGPAHAHTPSGYVYHVPPLHSMPQYQAAPAGHDLASQHYGGHDPSGHHPGYRQDPRRISGQGHPPEFVPGQSQRQTISSPPVNNSIQCSSPGSYSQSPVYSQNLQSTSPGQGQGHMNFNIPPEVSHGTKLQNTSHLDETNVLNQTSAFAGSHGLPNQAPTPCDINQVVKSPDWGKTSPGKGTVYQNYPRPDLPPLASDRKPADKPTSNTSQPSVRKKSEGYTSKWICEHCTFHNPAGTNVCDICFKTSSNPTFLDSEGQPVSTDAAKSESPKTSFSDGEKGKMSEAGSRAEVAGRAELAGSDEAGGRAEAAGSEETKVLREASEAGKKLVENIDQIYLEKQEAHRKFNEQLKKEQEQQQLLERQRAEEARAAKRRAEAKEVEVNRASASTGQYVMIGNDGVPVPTAISSEETQIEKQSTDRTDNSSADKSVSESQLDLLPPPSKDQMTVEPQAASGDPSKSSSKPQGPGRTGLSFTETMDKINRERQNHQSMIEGRELVQYIKSAEQAGFDIEEAQIAMEKESIGGMLPLTYLKDKWRKMIETVITMAANEGANMVQNEVGEVSSHEAREALKETKGSVQQAVKICVKNRQKMYKEVNSESQFPREEVLRAMHQSNGDLDQTLDALNVTKLQHFMERLWIEDEGQPQGAIGGRDLIEAPPTRNPAHDVCSSITNSILGHTDFQNTVANSDVHVERRARMILVEGKLQSWGRAMTVIKILDTDVARNGLEATLEDIVEAVKNCGDRQSSLAYLQQECAVCYAYYPMGKIRSLNCPCKICVDCMKSYFELSIREKHVRNLCCPVCQLPDMENVNAASDYFTFLTMLLSTMVSIEILDLYHSKLRDWHLQKDPNFRWCTHCGGGFIYGGGDNLAMTCPHCQKKTCYKCKKQWEDQHEGLTCEQFEQWKIDNDPENQAMGLAAHLEANGIDCPSCKMRYSLAKGGCMHFTCPQCGHQFCSGCGQMFDSQGMCNKYRSCQGKGLHCHHPRDCFYYLRDNDVPELQKMLKDRNINFNTEMLPHQGTRNNCPVMEQKEVNDGKQDEACGKEIQPGHAGLCVLHYKEYLVGLINKNRLDPVHMMNIEELIRLIERNEKTAPQRKSTNSDSQYRKKLVQFIKEKIPLKR